MSRLAAILLALLAAALIVIPGSMADEAGAQTDETGGVSEEESSTEEQVVTPTHPLTDLPDEHEDVETTYLFPEHPQLSMPSGDKVDVLLGFHNGGESMLNVTGIMGSLNSPLDFRVYIQNFSLKAFNAVVSGGEEASLEYAFTPDSNLQPRDFAVALTVFYEGDGEKFSTTFFNNSILIVEPSSFVDLETIFAYVFVLAIVGLLIALAVRGLQSAGIVKKNMMKAKKIESSSSRGDDGENEWLKGTNAVGLSSKSRAVKKKTTTKKK